MSRPFLSLVLCAVVALSLVSAAIAADRQPKRLWDEFPLEPTVTPEATPRSQPVAPARDDDGMKPGALIALMVAAGGLGAITARLASRRIPRARRAGQRPAQADPVEAGRAGPVAAEMPMPEPPQAEAPPAEAPAAEARWAQPAPPKASSPPPSATSSRPPPATSSPPLTTSSPPPVSKPAPTRRFEPAAGAAPTARWFTPDGGSCSIRLSTRPPLGRFVAIAAGGRVVARSAPFRLKREEGDHGLSPPEALRSLVEELTAAGWRKTGAGSALWDLRFERQPQDAVTRRASPPRA